MTRQVESVEDDAGAVVYYHRHENGGGLVGRGAVVADSARLGPMTYVEPHARIGACTRVGHGSWIDRQVQVGGADHYRRRRPRGPRNNYR